MQDRLDNMTIFVAVAERQSFAEAARQLTRSPASVTRAVAALEERLQTRLFNRTTRSVALTDAGVRTGGGRQDDLRGGRHPLTSLYYAGQDVLTTWRLLSQKRLDPEVAALYQRGIACAQRGEWDQAIAVFSAVTVPMPISTIGKSRRWTVMAMIGTDGGGVATGARSSTRRK